MKKPNYILSILKSNFCLFSIFFNLEVGMNQQFDDTLQFIVSRTSQNIIAYHHTN